MALVTNTGALSAAAQRLSEAACSAFEDILVDVLRAGPREAAGVVAADDVEGRAVGRRPHGKDHRHQRLPLRRQVVRRLRRHALRRLEQHQRRRVGPGRN